MRPALVLLLGLAACTPDAPADGSPTDADRLLARVAPAALAPAFAALDARDVTADLVVALASDEGAPSERRYALRQRDGEATTEDGPAPRLQDPLAAALPEDPPYADPASRDQYRRAVVGDTVVGGRRLALVEAVLTDPDAEQGVRRVRAAVDPASGQPIVVTVHRALSSAVFDEQSRVSVELMPDGDGWLPRRVETDTRTDVPLSPGRRVRTEWTVTSVDGRPLR